MSETLFGILLLIFISSIVGGMIYAYLKSNADERFWAEELEKRYREQRQPRVSYCCAYNELNQLQLNKERVDFAYVHSPEDKRGLYIWVPNDNEWLQITR